MVLVGFCFVVIGRCLYGLDLLLVCVLVLYDLIIWLNSVLSVGLMVFVCDVDDSFVMNNGVISDVFLY